MLKEFKEFAVRGNMVDMAVGIVVGGAFTTIVRSLVDDVLMPPLGLLLGGVDFSNFFVVLKDRVDAGPFQTLADAQASGAVTLNYGLFANALVSFLIVAFALFTVVKAMNQLRRQEETAAAPTTRDCPKCQLSIPLKAVRCPHCTSDIEAA